MKKLSVEMLLGIGMLLFAIGFNLWTYRMEPSAKIDPNDNTFQYALVDRTNQIWDYADKTCSGFFISNLACYVSLLTDHWVPNWAEGYNLPYYYSHIPQILIVASHRLIDGITHLSLFQHYHWITYLLLSFFPLSLFLALRIAGLSWLTAGTGALLATHLSTDGLYGLDPASFLWRGYGLSSQLFAMIWLPLAIAYAWRYLHEHKKSPIPAILTMAATTAGHLGIGIIAFMSVGIISLSNLSDLIKPIKKLLVIYGGVLLLLGYWILPILLHGDYHNISFWDPVWKFDSYGAKETLIRLFNGDLFDFGRLPILTFIAFVGLLTGLTGKYFSFSLLFVFWLLMYFGRTTWGGFIDLIPGMEDFHLSRFIVGLQAAGMFLIPIGLEWLVTRISISRYVPRFRPFVTLSICYFVISVIVVALVYPQTVRYSKHNDVLIKQANDNFRKVESDVSLLLSTMRELQKTNPGRVFAGRGGGWGRGFEIAETPYYMHLSTYGIPTVLWLPQTWSPNSDTEQYFSEDQAKDYALYNIRYVVAPLDQKAQPFWKLTKESPSWRLYSVIPDPDPGSTTSKTGPTWVGDNESMGYITTGLRPAIISADKESFINVVRLWIQSDYHKNRLYPELTFDKNYPKTIGLPNFRMLDEATYKVPNGTDHSLFAEPPRYEAPKGDMQLPTIISQSNNTDMVFTATVEVKEGCVECLVVLRQTFHPSWKATVDEKPAQTITVFPFYTAVKVENAGAHEIVFSYQPSTLKMILLLTSLTLCMIFAMAQYKRKR